MASLKIDYKKELETASRGMIMIHDPKLLIKLILRMIIRKLGVRHAAMVLHDPEKNIYVLSISKGETGLKIPSGFTRFDANNPIIRLFSDKEFRHLVEDRKGIVQADVNRLVWQEGLVKNGNGWSERVKQLLYGVLDRMEMLNTIACVPAYYRDLLTAVLLLGEKYDGAKYDQEELDFFAALASDAAMAIRNAQLFKHLNEEIQKNKQQFLQTLVVLSKMIEAKDAYTHGHSERVTDFSLDIARQMVANGKLQYSKRFFDDLHISSLLHDIGKVGVPEAILNKNGRLTDDEFEIVKSHPARGADIISPMGLSQECVSGVRHHHERYDGKGYPDRLSGECLPMISAIISVADSYDAMISDRPYRKGLAKETAVSEIRNNTNTQFHPAPAEAFLLLCQKGKI